MKTIPLTQGKVALVSDKDYGWLSKWKWHARCGASGLWYAKRTEWKDSKFKTIWMHREIVGAPSGVFVDHRDGDGLNNARSNLRIATCAQNQHNQRVRTSKRVGKDKSSKYKGVSWKPPNQKWQAAIRLNGTSKYLGIFADEDDAARAYNAAAVKHYGTFAKLNEID